MHYNKLFAALAAVAALTSTSAAMADDTPFAPRPITIVSPTPPGGGNDVLARLFAEKLAKSLNQTVIVDNRAGANGIIGTDFVAKGPADGTRILFTYAATIVINPALYKKLPYDPLKDLIPVAQVGRGGNLMLVKKDLPVNNIKEFVAYAKAHPGKLSYCSWGNGSGGHLTMENFKKQAGIDLTHVPYKGAAPCTQDLMGGQVDASFADAATTTEAVKSGRIKAMAYSGAARLPALPDVPTLNEAGYPFKNYTWYGVFLPAKTPPALVKRLNEAVNAVQKDPAVVKRLHELNLTDIPLVTSEQFTATVKQDLQDWNTMVKSVGVTLD